MQTSVTFRHMDASDALRNHAVEKINRMTKYFNEPAEAHVVLSANKFHHRAEVNILAHGMTICGKETSNDMYHSIDRSLEKIEKQVKKYRDKLNSQRPKSGVKMKMRFKLLEGASSTAIDEISELPPTIVETKEFIARPMMLDEAVMQMDLLHNDILVFLNVKSDQINILYRKKDSKYGLIETVPNGGA